MAKEKCKKRNITSWGKYNDDLVRRGEYVWDLGFLESWDLELKLMNCGKTGRPYEFPDSLFWSCIRIMAVTNIRLRMLEGKLRCVLGAVGHKAPDHSTIDERCSLLTAEYPDRKYGEYGVMSVDSTCISVADRGEWLSQNYHLKRGFVKLHIGSEPDTCKILAHRVTDEHTGDSGMLLPLADEAETRGFDIIKVLADAAYDARTNWQGLVNDRKIKDVVINLKSNDVHANGCMYKGQMIAERNQIGQDQWKKDHGYGTRWKSECVNADFKKMTGQFTRSRSWERIVKELDHKVQVFNQLKEWRGQ
ncbi:MAG: IS5 family transposase [Methanomassiliicoccaceae archaeon]|nr:IS5 family transposase [Methanomassiliicoccaceae archaeon]